MKVVKTKLKDCSVICPDLYRDDRGFFQETFHQERYFDQAGITTDFVQDNHSRSKKGILRGLHIQENNPQGKLVRVSRGEVFDVAVDLRRYSDTFGQWHSEILNDENMKQFWIPPGFAHGFLVLSDEVDFEYKCTEYYDPDSEISVLWNDPDLNIAWPIETPILSKKDSEANLFSNLFR